MATWVNATWRAWGAKPPTMVGTSSREVLLHSRTARLLSFQVSSGSSSRQAASASTASSPVLRFQKPRMWLSC